ncbi:hypothetical protein [uncultured Desulfosarcina sp.]|uniref:hypothetical protein n=1 Tax=uncultured Desulfosarcina sp. TaxID=218289 RepID=UPI0029C8FB71|nr:hypothetical protein [uncultured Desulfosarcina sp.]
MLCALAILLPTFIFDPFLFYFTAKGIPFIGQQPPYVVEGKIALHRGCYQLGDAFLKKILFSIKAN